MSRLESTGRFLRRWFTSIPFFILLGLALGVAIAVPAIPKPSIATISISGAIMEQAYTDAIQDKLNQARDDNSIKAVVLEIDSPGGYVVTTESIYLDVLRLRQQKPVVVMVKMMAASGGYYIAAAANFIYALPTSQIGSIGVVVGLPRPEELDEDTLTTGLFKATGTSRREAVARLEIVRQEFLDVVISQRGDRLKLSEEELSQAALYLGVESLRYGLIDDLGTITDAIEKAASLAGIRNYEVVKLYVPPPSLAFFFSGSADLKSPVDLIPVYYYLHFESE